jgi:4-hydroxy-tetrahydrodipicolinate synthase
VPTPWDAAGCLAEGMLERNIDRYAEAGIDGVYTTDSDGEFYAIELEDFRRLVKVFARRMHGVGLPAAVGVSWSHTAGIVERIRIAVDAGIPTVHVAFPAWIPLAPSDVDRFFDDLSEVVPAARWVHYNNPQTRILLTGKDYARFAATYPEQLVGSKQGTTDLQQLAEIIEESPHLAHFGVEYNVVLTYLLGGKGWYSYWVNVLPGWERVWRDACETGNWELAWQMQRKLLAWERTHIVPTLRRAGHSSGIVGKARAALSNFLEDTGNTKPPYYPADPQMQQSLKTAFRSFWAEELRAESFVPTAGPVQEHGIDVELVSSRKGGRMN